MSSMGQARDILTVAELRAWCAAVVTTEDVRTSPYQLATATYRVFQPCPGCGGPVSEGDPPAASIDWPGKTVTFGPCGCVLTITQPLILTG